MIKINPAQELDNLEKELIHLSKENLPVPTRAAIQSARKKIGLFRDSLEKKREGDKIAALYRVSQSLGTSLDLDEVLNQVMDAVIQLTGAERGFLSLINQSTGALSLQAARNFEQESIPQNDIELSHTVVRYVLDRGKGIVTTDAQTDPRFANQESVVLYSLRSILCAPLQRRGVTIGVIYVDNRTQSNLFTPDDLEILSAFASQACVAIENAGLYTQTDQALKNRVAELETLTQIDRQLNENLNIQHITELTREWAIRGTKGKEAWIVFNEKPPTPNQVLKPNGAEVPLSVKKILNTLSDSSSHQIIREGKKSPVYLISPIQHAGENIGMIIVSHPEGFSKQASAFLNRLSARASTAIENALLYQAVQEANESKSQFVSIVTHELRIPLTSIKGYSDLIQQGLIGPVNDQQKEFLTIIQNNTDRMADLISDLSDISRIERGVLKINPAPLPLHGYVEETVTRLLPKIEEKQQKLTIDVPKKLPSVYADPNRLVQVLTNLVSNAWKYTPANGKIIIRASLKEEKAVKIEIIDNGLGISEDDQTKIFSQFFRSESADVREQTGWGLGLNVTKKIVEIMGGSIGMSSTLGSGSTFWFTLPISEPEAGTSGK